MEKVFILTAHTVFFAGSILQSSEIVTVGSDGSLLVWDRSDGSLLADLPLVVPDTPRTLTDVITSDDDKVLVTAGEDSLIKVYITNQFQTYIFNYLFSIYVL